ncbi:hypothetical protein D3C80_1132440 [compost metagenome]
MDAFARAVILRSGIESLAAGTSISFVQRPRASAVSQRMAPAGSSLIPCPTEDSSMGEAMPQPFSSPLMVSNVLNSAPNVLSSVRQACNSAGGSSCTGITASCFSSAFAFLSSGLPSDSGAAGGVALSSGFGWGLGVSASAGFSAALLSSVFSWAGFCCGTGTVSGGFEAEISSRLAARITKR